MGAYHAYPLAAAAAASHHPLGLGFDAALAVGQHPAAALAVAANQRTSGGSSQSSQSAAAVVHAAGASSAALEAATSGINISISINGAAAAAAAASQSSHYTNNHQTISGADLTGHLNFSTNGTSSGSGQQANATSRQLSITNLQVRQTVPSLLNQA